MSEKFDPQSTTLETELVRLEPLELGHAEELFAAGDHAEIWRYLVVARPTSVRDTEELLRFALEQAKHGVELPFTIRHKPTSKAAGTTRFLDIQRRHRGLEIGWTWVTPAFQRSGVNTHCKYLLMRHAFESLGAIRVCFKTDRRNEGSQRAIERIGGKKEGVLRSHYIMSDGYRRDSVYFSVLDHEWPAVKTMLESKMDV